MSARPLRVVALGDSITSGQGVPPGAAYPDLFFQRLRHSPECRLENLAISGITSGELLTLIRQKFTPRLLPATCITMSVGGNDFLRRFAAGHWNPYSYFCAVQRMWQTIPLIIQELIRLAPAAPIFVLGFYNPYPAAWRGHRTAERIVGLLNRQYHNRVAAPQVTFIDLAQVLPKASAGWLCDGIHPSVEGHRRIAEAVVKAYRTRISSRSAYRGPRDEVPKSVS
ncbi:MAG: SGNH/GDSL hydrolase family protein [Alicyclobacillaceae bacterium]|nr:SGNH/GDSL hydrolase family protein [Alicyclobacillaceae bacterium]